MAKVQQLTPAQRAAQQNQTAVSANMQAREVLLQNSYPVIQAIYSETIDPNSAEKITVIPRNVGLVTDFIVDIEAVVANNNTTPANTLIATDFGAANLLQRAEYRDLANQPHTQTSGWHLHMINTAKQGSIFGSVTQQENAADYPFRWDASTGRVTEMDRTIPGHATTPVKATIKMVFKIPLAYSETDLTGAVLANVPQGQQSLELTMATNNSFFTPAAKSLATTLAGYYGAGTGDIESMKVTVYQRYLDQIPQGGNGNFIIPLLDISTIYALRETQRQDVTSGSDTNVEYANLYRYLSTVVQLDNKGTPADSTIEYVAQRSASFSDIRNLPVRQWRLLNSQQFDAWTPPGTIYIDNRSKPIFTLEYGNVTLSVRPKGVIDAGAILRLGYEYFQGQDRVTNAGVIR